MTRTRLISTLAPFALIAGVVVAPAASASTASTSSATVSTVGALFANGSTSTHGCTASVVSSTSGDLIITAAHCVQGNGAGMRFVPGYRYGAAPYGSWTTTQAYVPSSWASWHNPQADVAVLRVNRPIQNVVGSNRIASSAPATGMSVTTPAYVAGSGDHQRLCTANISWTSGYPTFGCGGYAGGTSGAPFLRGGLIYGVIGGLHQGGCSPAVSYSSNLAAQGVAASLVSRAQSHAAANRNISPAGYDGC